jgi:hypothetical protein
VADLVEPHPEHVERNDRDLDRQHDRRQDQDERELAATPAHPRQCVGHGHAGQHDPDRGQDADLCGVPHVLQQWDPVEDLGEVVPDERPRPERRRHGLVVGHERRQHHEDERRHEHGRDGDEHGVPSDGQQEPPPPHVVRDRSPVDLAHARVRGCRRRPPGLRLLSEDAYRNPPPPW